MSSPAPLLLLCGIKTTFYWGQCRARPPCTQGHPLGIPHQLLWPWGWHGDRDKVHELGQCQDKHLEPPARPLCRRSHPFLLLGMAREHRHTPASAHVPPRHPPCRQDGADALCFQRASPPPRRPWAGATVPQPGVAPAASRQLPGEGVRAPYAGSSAGDPSHTLAEGRRAPALPATRGSGRQRCSMNSLVPRKRRLIPSMSPFVLLGSNELRSFTTSARNIPDVFQNTAAAPLSSESQGYGNLHPAPPS